MMFVHTSRETLGAEPQKPTPSEACTSFHHIYDMKDFLLQNLAGRHMNLSVPFAQNNDAVSYCVLP